MARYIDADKLIDELNYNTTLTWARGLGSAWWSHAVNLKDNMLKCIDRIPTADVVEVVRCGECTKWDAHEGDEYGTCANGDYVSRNDYCCWGERRTDER